MRTPLLIYEALAPVRGPSLAHEFGVHSCHWAQPQSLSEAKAPTALLLFRT
jgi:hypothetical protein